MTVRAAAEGDVLPMAGIYVRAYAQPPWNEWNDPAQGERYLRWVMSQPGTHGLVTVENDRLAGFILAGQRAYADFVEDWARLAEPPPEGWPLLPGKLGYIWEIAVDPVEQRRRHGTALMAAAIEQLKTEGVATVVLRSNERATAAMALYRRFGFQRLPVRERRDPLAGPWVLPLGLAPPQSDV